MLGGQVQNVTSGSSHSCGLLTTGEAIATTKSCFFFQKIPLFHQFSQHLKELKSFLAKVASLPNQFKRFFSKSTYKWIFDDFW